MGLDIIELILEAEDMFDIKILDEDAAQVQTVGQLYEVIRKARLGVAPAAEICLSAATFYAVRRGICEVQGATRSAVRPSTELDAVLPPAERSAAWFRLRQTIGLDLPRLRRPAWLVSLCVTLSGALAIGVGLLVLPEYRVAGAAWSGLGAIVFGLVFSHYLTAPLIRQHRSSFATVGGLSRCVLQANWKILNKRYNGGGAIDVWDALRYLIVEQLGVPLEQVTWNAKFGADLGFN